MMLRPAVLVLVAAAAPLAAWGQQGHRMVATLALQGLPPDLAAFLKGREGDIREMAMDPDMARSHDRKEGLRHYLDVEYFGTVKDIPRSAEAAFAVARAKGFNLEKAGLVPWMIADRERRLVAAFKAGDAARAAEELAWLGHYVADIHVPLHATRNHDGQETDQKGLHSRWESGLVERFVDEKKLRLPALDAKPLDPFLWLEESFALVPQVLAHDLEAFRGETRTRPTRTAAYWQNFWVLERETVIRRLELAAARLRAITIGAWQRR